MKKIISFICIVGALLYFTLTNGQEAASPDIGGPTNALHNLIKTLDLLNAIKNNRRTIDATTLINTLQSTMNDTVRVFIAETEDLEMKIGAFKNLDKDKREAQIKLIEELFNIRINYQNLQEEINQKLSLKEVTTLAEMLKDTREKTQNSLNAIIDFISVFENRDATIIAANRLQTIARDEWKIKSLLPKNKWASFFGLFKEAHFSITLATQFNKRAYELLTEPNPESGETVESLTAASGEKLKQAYDIFLIMSKLLKK